MNNSWISYKDVMVKQVRFSESVKFFEQGFLNRWNLDSYYNIHEPCFFAGVYDSNDIKIINTHKGFKVIWNTGRIRDIFTMINPENVIVMDSGVIDHSSIKGKYKIKKASIQIKDFSMFKPGVLGDKIYCYLGDTASKEIMGFSFMEKLKMKTPFDIIYGFLGNNIEFVKEQYYDKCFVNIKPNVIGGITTAAELAYMGRMTISNTKTPFCINYKNDILDIITKESKKIGTLQSSMIGDFYNIGDEWKQVKFWYGNS